MRLTEACRASILNARHFHNGDDLRFYLGQMTVLEWIKDWLPEEPN